ncbi:MULTISPECIES: PAS domain-containing sensor histidine kinase [unclassified Paracoccus (in: a-proteobacteria)]|uniref:hybrid sensor histidine kinase/response regulator n=1 Tax=unclassified Paracoccus (in: a-proteobacteria) TaxID=2688777 RepID=UPI001602F529|nr:MULTISPECIES: PAS domain-containing sensor histidine kinase [unclassified Paracoccus (in: a-proteobacteria)]MBB1490336.1 response regulator [Paracoccus sp. MC1854]MBB1497178.1 response regulator [Paracoccus sp. MC1862]QQO44844.1 response regulator [Paracoccus sp. MC1862]
MVGRESGDEAGMKQGGLLSSGRLAAVPVLMLPVVLGALWLALAPAAVPPRVLVIAGTVAVAWYLLGGMIAGRRLLDQLSVARQVRAARVTLADEPGCAWIVDSEGAIRGQSAPAGRLRDLTGRDAAALLAGHRANPAAAAAALLARVADGRPVQLPLGDGLILDARRIPDSTLQFWRIETPQPEPAATAAGIGLDYRTVPIALLDLDPDGHVLTTNLAAEALLGPIAPGTFLGDLLEGPGRPLGDWLAEVREGRDTGRGEVLQTRTGDVERALQVTLASSPGIDRIVAVLTDVSALKTLEAQFVQSQKMQAIGQLAGGIAHDFNNLLTAITGHCDLLMLRRDNTDPDYADLHQISQNANRAAALVRQLLAFSRKQTLSPEIIDLRHVLSDLSHLLNRLVGERIIVTVTNDPSLRPIRADGRQFEQVLINLAVNARDAMPKGGEIAIRSENVRLRTGLTLEGASIPQGEYVRITVSDQGCGIPPETLDKIFDPFFTTKKQGEGTGLGLSTVYGIVKQTGGYIFCTSTPGEGTIFALYFPAQRPRPAERPAPAAASPASPRSGEDHRRTVLLVEDEAPVRAFAARALRLHGFDVIEADSGERALQILSDAALRVDIFLTDVVMPGLDGPGWVRMALQAREGTRVIFMSGYMDATLSDNNMAIPNALFLPKPFSLSELVATVESHLAGSMAPARPTDGAPPDA